MAKFCPKFDFGLLYRVKWGQVGQKLKKSANFGNAVLKHCFPLLKYYTSGANFSKIRQYLGQLGLKKKTQKGPFHGCCIARKTLENL